MSKVQGSLSSIGNIFREEVVGAPKAEKADDRLGRLLMDGEAQLTPKMKKLIDVGQARPLSIAARRYK